MILKAVTRFNQTPPSYVARGVALGEWLDADA